MTKYNIQSKELRTHLVFGNKLNCTNYACHQNIELYFAAGKPIHLYNAGKLVTELEQSMPLKVEQGGLMSTSRGVESFKHLVYFVDNAQNLYCCNLKTVKQLIDENKIAEIKKISQIIATRTTSLAYSKEKKQLYYSNTQNQIVKEGTKIGCQFGIPQNVSYMVASHGIVAVSTFLTKSVGSIATGNIVMNYHILSQEKLSVMARPFTKEGDYFARHQILKMVLINVPQGLLMVGLPNFETCDLLLANRGLITPLAIDKKLGQVCHWSMAGISNSASANIYIGSVQGIFKLSIKL